MEQESPYGNLQHYISAMQQVVELQLFSPQIEEFIRFVEFCTLIA
jgi:hypothetical protein